jgi:hypothetical protein
MNNDTGTEICSFFDPVLSEGPVSSFSRQLQVLSNLFCLRLRGGGEIRRFSWFKPGDQANSAVSPFSSGRL